MFVRQSKYDAAQTLLAAWQHAYNEKVREWNNLVAKINAKGGMEFLNNATLKGSSQFTEDELKTLRRLCHPDKHDSSKSSNELSAKINNLLSK